MSTTAEKTPDDVDYPLNLEEAFEKGDLESLVRNSIIEPTWAMVVAIVGAFSNLATTNPGQADAYTSVLYGLHTSTEIPNLAPDSDDEEAESEQEKFVNVLARQVYESIKDLLNVYDYEEGKSAWKTAVDQSNKYLIASIVSGSAIQHNVSRSADQYGHITEGLALKSEKSTYPRNSKLYEINAVGAFLQVLAAGSTILDGHGFLLEELKARVFANADAAITDIGKKIATLARAHAENDFKDAISSQDLWRLLSG